MPTLNALRVRGASIDATVGTPSFSRPGRATLAVGAPPAIHGVTTNRQKRNIPLDNLVRRVGTAGGTCRIAGSKIWSGLFAEDIARCGVYLEGESKEGPGMFVPQVPAIRAAQERGIEFVLEKPAMLRIADIISSDFAAHEYGGASPEYQAELQRIDAVIAVLASRLDLSRETLVITADHGHRDEGGHGGDEAEVLAIPIVMVGAGIRSSVTIDGEQADIAPTLAALLGLPLPAASSGHPLEAALLADDAKLAMIKGASQMQKEAFLKAVDQRLGNVVVHGGVDDWGDLFFAFRDNLKQTRQIVAAFSLVVCVGVLVVALKVSGPGATGLAAGVSGMALALLAGVAKNIPTMSFSAINYDEMLLPFFERIMTLAAITALAGITGTLLTGRFMSRARGVSPVSTAATIGLLPIVGLGAPLLVSWAWNLLLHPIVLPGPNAMVAAYALTLSIASVSATTLIVVAVLFARERANGLRLAPQRGPAQNPHP